MRYSGSAIALMILLGIRVVGQAFNLALLNEISLGFAFFMALISGIIYLIAFVGILKQSRWGLILTLIIGLIDLVSAILYFGTFQVFFTIVIDIVLVVLSINILTRIRRK
jgi:hypothetical protein